MKKTLIILIVVLLIGAGYFTYDKWIKKSDVTAWDFVPSDAALVLDLSLAKDLEEVSSNPIWENLIKAEGIQAIENGLNFLDSINGNGGFSSIFRDVPTLISTHKVSSASLDFLFVLDVQNLSQNTFISAGISRMKAAGYRFRTRNYNGFKISEIGSGADLFTYIFHKNYFLGSFTPYLVEDAIRTIEEVDILPYHEVHPVSPGMLHVNYKEFGNLVSAFTAGKIALPLSSGSYEVSLDSVTVSLSGFSEATDSWVSTHRETPKTFDMAEVIPFNTSLLYHITSHDFVKWDTEQSRLSQSPAVQALKDSLKSNLDFTSEQVFSLLDGEIGLAMLESGRPDNTDKFFILKVKDGRESLAFFEQLSERIAYARGDSVYTESYSENEIRFLPIPNFPSAVIGDLAEDFERCFYFNYRNYIIFSNSIQELKGLVTSTVEEDTWGKSIRMNNFLEKANAEANVSLIVNIPRFWPTMLTHIKPEWLPYFKANEKTFKRLELAAFQFSYLDQKYFTNFTFSQPPKYVESVIKTSPDNAVAFASPLISKPYLVRTHAHSYFDILLQDSSFNLYYLDRTFSSLWSKELADELVSEVFAIDYYRNNKLQYAFATKTQVHIIDRLGNYLPGFPKKLNSEPTIAHFTVIDYEKSRNYRLGVTDEDGKVYLTDKDLKVLVGWDPIPYRRPAIGPLKHARLGRRDVMISVQENGIANIANRRGERLSGFPFDLEGTSANNYFLNASNSLGSSSIVLLSKQGELFEVNLEGNIINRDQLIKESPETAFRLVPDRGGKSFVIVRNEGSTYEVLDATGNLLFTKDYLSEEEIITQYYQFGAGKDLVVFTDTANESLFIYDKSGALVTGNPLRSAAEISIVYSSSKKELQVFTSTGSNLEFYSFDY